MVRSVARASVVSGGAGLSSRRAAMGALLALVATTRTAAATDAKAPRPMLVLGDSLSAEYGLPRGSGWVALLEKRLAERRAPYRVVNASISGETTAGGRSRLPDLLARHSPAIVVVELGGNDALRGLPLAGTEQNLREMIRAAKAANARPLLLGMRMPPNYGRAYGEQFEAVFRRVADAERVPLVPFFLEAFGDKADHFQADRIHPAERAQPLMLDAVWPALSRLL
jgi:acyl-CoA thioesterase-1